MTDRVHVKIGNWQRDWPVNYYETRELANEVAQSILNELQRLMHEPDEVDEPDGLG